MSAAGLLALLPFQAMAAPAAGQDQYLEVVPGGGGDQSPRQFSRSLGGAGGPVTERQIVVLARRNAARGRGGGGAVERSGGGPAGGAQPANDSTALITAAAKQPFSPPFGLVLGAALLVVAVSGLWLRTRGGDADTQPDK